MPSLGSAARNLSSKELRFFVVDKRGGTRHVAAMARLYIHTNDDLKELITAAAVSDHRSVSEWLELLALREIEARHAASMPPKGVPPLCRPGRET
jgi:hypothetical protein